MCCFEFGDALLNARLRFRGVLLAFSCGCGRGLTCSGLVVGLGLDKPRFAARDGDEIQDAFLVGRFCVLAGVRKFGFEFGDTCVSRRQRIGIARALVLNPKFVVCDEPVSALDVSIQAQVLNLMLDIQERMGLTYIFITHDLSVVKYISNDIMVMYLGQMVEKAPADELFMHRYHPYTRALISAVPIPDIDHKRERIQLKGELTSPINPKPGCRFAARCIYAKPECFEVNPEIEEITPGHFVRCHCVRELNNL